MASCAARNRMPADAYLYRGDGTQPHPTRSRSFDIMTSSPTTTRARVAVSNTILIGISMAIAFLITAGTDVALILLFYLDESMPISFTLAWALMFLGTWALASWIMYRVLVFVKFAPFRGGKHNERHQC